MPPCGLQEVAKDQLSEGTLGCSNADNGRLLHALFNCHNYMVTPVEDVAGVEMAGTLKNVVALGAGFVDGFDAGVNTKACRTCQQKSQSCVMIKSRQLS